MRFIQFIALFAAFSTKLTEVFGWFPDVLPDYCTGLQTISSRKIPPLTFNQSQRVDTLQQLQIVNRHGARTPYASYSCWNNYSVIWNNCNVTELMLASPSYTSEKIPAKWLFRKLYDGSPNDLGGNCLTGQLIGVGYNQTDTIGKYLNEAYLKNSNPKLNIFQTDVWADINSDAEIYLRSDDEERTLLSGQTIMHGMFNVTEKDIVDWHTGDYNLDQIYPNTNVCPRLNTVQDNWYASSDFQSENNSEAVVNLTDTINNIQGVNMWEWYNELDCLMTTVCTGNPLPDGFTEDIFNQAVAQATYYVSDLYVWNSSQYAKLAMGNTVWHMRNNINTWLNFTDGNSATTGRPLKLAQFSGHDTTVMPLLATILGDTWNKVWAPYASLMTVELYNSTGSEPTDEQYLFRLTYNGEALTVPGCDDELCNLSVLMGILEFGQEYMPCTADASSTSTCDSNSSDNTLGLGIWIMIVFLSFLSGALITISLVVFRERYILKTNKSAFETSQNPMIHNENI